ncbi:MAG: 50S ribosomal protein L4 [Verrucomicrobia bacterium]|nr:50S ribosomal protein L4 [Verrucomicrobiota bacterium]MDA1085746.1 50S ribosomal protein L4 [Verrucomicrobiota bacterium]
MSTLKIYAMDGSAKGEATVDDSLLETERGTQAVHDVIVAYRAAQRAGTASTLSKGEVAGSGAKPWKQKGTGRARAGYRQSPLWRGGAVCFGPKPRDYSKKVNRKTGRLAFRRALSEKIKDGAIRLIDKLEFAEPKTSVFAAFLKALELRGPMLLVLSELSPNVCLSARNIARLEITTADTLNTYQLVRYPNILVESTALEALKGRMAAATVSARSGGDAE